MKPLKIIGCDYEVLEVPIVSREEYKLGEVDHVGQNIKIAQELKKQRKAEVLLHEIIHCLLFAFGESEAHNDERLISSLAGGFIQTIRDNPDLLLLLSTL